MKAIIKTIETISEYTGKSVHWLCIALVLVLTYDTVARYVFNAPPVWAYETSWMIGATMAVMGWSYTHRHHGHIRVDVFYTRLSHRGKAIIDVVCSLIFLFPLLAVLLYSSSSFTMFAWKMNQKLVESSWMPPATPILALIAVGIYLFTLQCIAQFMRDVYQLIRGKPYDTT